MNNLKNITVREEIKLDKKINYKVQFLINKIQFFKKIKSKKIETILCKT